MDYNTFLVLTNIERNKKININNIIDETNLEPNVVGNIINDLRKNGYIDHETISKPGLKALEPYRVKRAVFIAAGFGSRMLPLTINTPKPLVRVNGTRMIDTLLDAITSVGIKEIYIVNGHLGEQFEVLKNKYPTIKLIENKDYCRYNNISSMMLCKDLLQNAYVLEADLVLSNPNLITKYQYRTNYLGFYTKETDDWCFKADENKHIIGYAVGGKNVYQMIGISYWDEKDGKQLGKDLESVFSKPDGKQLSWDVVTLDICNKNYILNIRECLPTDIVEIDGFDELKNIDPAYDI